MGQMASTLNRGNLCLQMGETWPYPLRSTQLGVQNWTPIAGEGPPETDVDMEEFVTDFIKLFFSFPLMNPQTNALLQQEFPVFSICNSPGQREKAWTLERGLEALADLQNRPLPPKKKTSLQSSALLGLASDIIGLWVDFQCSQLIRVGTWGERHEKLGLGVRVKCGNTKSGKSQEVR